MSCPGKREFGVWMESDSPVRRKRYRDRNVVKSSVLDTNEEEIEAGQLDNRYLLEQQALFNNPDAPGARTTQEIDREAKRRKLSQNSPTTAPVPPAANALHVSPQKPSPVAMHVGGDSTHQVLPSLNPTGFPTRPSTWAAIQPAASAPPAQPLAHPPSPAHLPSSSSAVPAPPAPSPSLETFSARGRAFADAEPDPKPESGKKDASNNKKDSNKADQTSDKKAGKKVKPLTKSIMKDVIESCDKVEKQFDNLSNGKDIADLISAIDKVHMCRLRVCARVLSIASVGTCFKIVLQSV